MYIRSPCDDCVEFITKGPATLDLPEIYRFPKILDFEDSKIYTATYEIYGEI